MCIRDRCMAHTVCRKDEAYFKAMSQEVSDFLKGQDDKIIDELKSKMALAAQSMEFERAAEYRDLIQAIGTLRTKQRVMAKDLQNQMCIRDRLLVKDQRLQSFLR